MYVPHAISHNLLQPKATHIVRMCPEQPGFSFESGTKECWYRFYIRKILNFSIAHCTEIYRFHGTSNNTA